MLNRPQYSFDKIKFATDPPTFQRAIELYEKRRVTKFQVGAAGYSAIVLGSQPYQVRVSVRRYDEGMCTCYVGQNDTLCKHMVAVAIQAVKQGDPLKQSEKQSSVEPTCSGKLGVLEPDELTDTKRSIADAMRYIKSYEGPSRKWFAYQNSLSEGCARLSAIVSELPVSLQTAQVLVHLLLRLDKKLHMAVDDSDGTVGGFIESVVEVLKQFSILDKVCAKAFQLLEYQQTIFGWEEPLLRLGNKN